MIKSNELRIGNYVHKKEADGSLTVVKVLGIGPKKAMVAPPIEGAIVRFVKYEDLQPIELTEEILVKCGKDNIYSIDIKVARKAISFKWSSRVVSTGKRSGFKCNKYPHIKYLHQLQNLTYSLGQELEIKL